MDSETLINELKEIIILADKITSKKHEDLEEGEYHAFLHDCIARILLNSFNVKIFERSCSQYFQNPNIMEIEKVRFLKTYYALTTRKYVGYSLIGGECYANYPEKNIAEILFSHPQFCSTPSEIIVINTLRNIDSDEVEDMIANIVDKLPDYDDEAISDEKCILRLLSILLARIYNRGLIHVLEKTFLNEDYLLQIAELNTINEAKRAKEYTLNILTPYLHADKLRLFADDIYSLVLKGECPENIYIVNKNCQIDRKILRAFIFNIQDSFKRDKSWRKECAKLIITAFGIPSVLPIEQTDIYKKMTETCVEIPREKI